MKIFTCRFCEKDTSHKPSNRRSFCDSNCFIEFNRKYHPKQKRIERKCLFCKEEFLVILSSDKKFCSSSCSASYNNPKRVASGQSKENFRKAYLDGKLTGILLGQENGRLKRKLLLPIEKKCPVCKKKYRIHRWEERQGKKKYCSNKCARERPNQGGYRAGSVRNFKSGWYESSVAGKVWLDSSYEFIMATYLDEKGYGWRKNTKGFSYFKEDGSEHLYVPDFYIQDLDLWVETKGYVVENDKRKLDAFPHKIVLIGKSQIYDKTTWGF
ncbi:MAG: hypothetical protein M0R32_06460 [Candidatus Cloacimonetes bacterium]|jgi:hypothetical protein|nr:hypothetical protein [Candidatus Cloacimonadota bacterium]